MAPLPRLVTVVTVVAVMAAVVAANRPPRFLLQGGSRGGEVVVRMREGAQGLRGAMVLRLVFITHGSIYQIQLYVYILLCRAVR